MPTPPDNVVPDVRDPDIRAMVLRDHAPEEIWSTGRLVSVHCHVCCQRWPCPSILAARAAEQNAQATRRPSSPRWDRGG